MSNRLKALEVARNAVAEGAAPLESPVAVMHRAKEMRADYVRSLFTRVAAPRKTVVQAGLMDELAIVAAAERARGDRAAELGMRLGNAIGAWVRNLEVAFDRARAARELSRLDDRMLADIGISRSDIPALLAHGTIDRSGRMSPADAGGRAANDLHDAPVQKAAA